MLLNEKEREILKWTAEGKTAWETARIMHISSRTVEWYLQRIQERLGAANKLHTVALAIRKGAIGLIALGGLVSENAEWFQYVLTSIAS